MSTAFVRRAIYAALPTVLPGYVYVPTLNVETHPELLPASRWYTVDFGALEERRVSLGMPGCFTEEGVVTVTLAEPANGSDLPLADMAEAVRAAFIDWFDPTGQLRVYQVDPPFEVDGGDLGGAWWLMEVPMSYQFHRH